MINTTKCAICGAPNSNTRLDIFRVYICESCRNQDAEYIARKRAMLTGRPYKDIERPKPPTEKPLEVKPGVQPAPKKARQYKHCARVRTKNKYTLEMSSVIHGKYSPAQYIPMLGCTAQEFVRHIESQFQPGMSWSNYNLKGWHIDHYVPFSYFDCKDEKDMAACWNYQNLRPMWASDNLKKNATLPNDYKPTLSLILRSIGDAVVDMQR